MVWFKVDDGDLAAAKNHAVEFITQLLMQTGDGDCRLSPSEEWEAAILAAGGVEPADFEWAFERMWQQAARPRPSFRAGSTTWGYVRAVALARRGDRLAFRHEQSTSGELEVRG